MTEAGKTLAKDSIATLAMRILGTALSLVLGVITARALGPHERGLYVLPNVYAAIALSLLTGLTTATSYLMLNRKAGRGALAAAWPSAAILVALGVLPIIALAWIGHALWAALPALVALPLSAVINIAVGYAYGVKQVRYASAISVATTFFTLILMLLGLYLVSKTAIVAIVVWLTGMAIIAAVVTFMVLRDSRRLPFEPVTVREHLHYAWKIGLTNLISLLNYRIDVYAVAALAPTSALGIYTLAVSGAESMSVLTQVASSVTAPHIGSLDRAASAVFTARAARSNLLLAIGAATALFFIAPPVIVLLYGPAFAPSILAFRILLVGVVAISGAGIASNYFTLQLGDPNVPFRIAGFGAALCLVLSVILIPRMGIAGAALASSVAYLGCFVWGGIVFSRVAGVPWRDIVIPNRSDMAAYGRLAREFFKRLSFARWNGG